MKIAVVKYNAGNIYSVNYALKRLGVEATITSDKELLMSADKVIFPGVGEAETTMSHLRKNRLDEVIKNLKQPVLGICLGMQLMCRHSEEGNADCLGIFDTDVKLFSPTRHDGFISAARFALENKRLVYHIYNSVSRERVERYLYSIAGEVMRLYVSRITEQVEHAAHKKVFPEDQKMVVDFYKFALVGMILDWLNTGMKKDPEGLIRRVGEIFHGNIEAALTRVAR